MEISKGEIEQRKQIEARQYLDDVYIDDSILEDVICFNSAKFFKEKGLHQESKHYYLYHPARKKTYLIKSKKEIFNLPDEWRGIFCPYSKEHLKKYFFSAFTGYELKYLLPRQIIIGVGEVGILGGGFDSKVNYYRVQYLGMHPEIGIYTFLGISHKNPHKALEKMMWLILEKNLNPNNLMISTTGNHMLGGLQSNFLGGTK